MKKAMFSSFNFNLELILEDKFHVNILDTAVYMNVSGRGKEDKFQIEVERREHYLFHRREYCLNATCMV